MAQILVTHHTNEKINGDVFKLYRDAKKGFEKMVNVRKSKSSHIGVIIYSIYWNPLQYRYFCFSSA